MNRTFVRTFRTAVARNKSSKNALFDTASQKSSVDPLDGDYIDFKPSDVVKSSLPFNVLKESETFGMLVRAENEDTNEQDTRTVRVVDREEYLHHVQDREPADPLSRYLPNTVEGKFSFKQLELPHELGKVINNHIIKPNASLKKLRESAAQLFIDLSKSDVHRAPRSKLEVDAHISVMFLHNYASITRVLQELQTKLRLKGKDFCPKKVLDVGYGPATGIVALNDLMGDDYAPKLRHAQIIGNTKGMDDMRLRAKLILSRQWSELDDDVKVEAVRNAEKNVAPEPDLSKMSKSQRKFESELGGDYIGEVKTKQLKVKTQFISKLGNNKYDLIILTHQLLKDPERFPYGIDDFLEPYLKCLEPGGHLVIVERGNPMGYEIVARARQIMIRPENYSPFEFGKLPRPYIRASQFKPQHEEKRVVETSEEDRDFEVHLSEKFGDVDDDDLSFEKELLDDYEAIDETRMGQPVDADYYLSVVSPYPNHLKCPLQMLKPSYYNYPKGSKLQWLNFQTSIMRPKFTLEFKRGSILGGKWAKPDDGVAPKGTVGAGSGRPNGKNNEQVNFTYLVMERFSDDLKSIEKVEAKRKEIKAISAEIEAAEEVAAKRHVFEQKLLPVLKEGGFYDETDTWARIIMQPMKRKGHVVMMVLTEYGTVEKWVIPKSLGAGVYHDARKANKGDWWPHGYKTRIVVFGNDSAERLISAKGEGSRKMKLMSQHEKFYDTFKNHERKQKQLQKRISKENKKSERVKLKKQYVEDFRKYNQSETERSISEQFELELAPSVQEYETKLQKEKWQLENS